MYRELDLFPTNFDSAYRAFERQYQSERCHINSRNQTWFTAIQAVVYESTLNRVLCALRAVVLEWKQRDTDESVRSWEYPLITLLWYLNIPPEQKGEVVETLMDFVACADDGMAGDLACYIAGLPTDRWSAIGLGKAAEDVLRDIEESGI